MRHLLLVSLVIACGSPPPRPLTSAGSRRASSIELPAQLPNAATCLGFTAAGDGALVVTTRSDRFDGDGGELRIWLGFVVVDGARPPSELAHDVTSKDDAAWRTERSELAAELSAVSLVPCIEVEARDDETWPLPDGGTVTAEWDPSPAINSDEDLENDVPTTGRVRLGDRTLATLTTGPHDGSDHERLGAVHRNPAGSSLALVIENADTGLQSQRVVVARTGTRDLRAAHGLVAGHASSGRM